MKPPDPDNRLVPACCWMLASWAAWLIATPVSLAGAESGAAERENHSVPVLTLYVENDTFANADRHYTSGVKLSWLSADLDAWGQEGWRQRLVERLPFVNRHETQKSVGFALGQSIYTPQDTRRVPPDPEDRP